MLRPSLVLDTRRCATISRVKALKSDFDLLNNTIEQGMAAGDFHSIESAFDANSKAYGLGYINKAHFDDTNIKIAKARDQHYLDEAEEVNTQYVKDEAATVQHDLPSLKQSLVSYPK
jgi:hypothetical protein